jgi:Glycosyl transferase family 11
MTTYIRVQPGNLGNQMFRYMLAHHLADQVPGAQIVGYQMPDWGLCSTVEVPPWRAPFVVPARHRIDIKAVLRRLATHENDGLDIYAYAQRLEYFGHNLARFRNLFDARVAGAPIGDDEIAVSIRAGDILAGIHPDYFPLPISFYRSLLAPLRLRPVFVGQLDDSWYEHALRDAFPDARFLTHDTACEDFQSLRHARHKVLAISTFSWLAGWLSAPDSIIHYPLAGLLNPSQRPQIDLAPLGDARYRFYVFPVWHYGGHAEDVAALLSARSRFGGYPETMSVRL